MGTCGTIFEKQKKGLLIFSHDFFACFNQIPAKLLLELSSESYSVELELQNLEFKINFGWPKSWIQDFGLPKYLIQDFGLPKSWIQDFGLPKSWIQDFGMQREGLEQKTLKMAEKADGEGMRMYIKAAFGYKQWVIFVLINTRFYW